MIDTSREFVAHNSLLSFYLAWQLEPNSSNYNLGFSYPLENGQNIDLLVEKLQVLIKQKAYLRQTFSLKNHQLIASIHNDLPAEINSFTSSKTNFAELEQALVKKPHEINKKSSIILNIIQFDDCNSCVVLFNIHHIIMDGYSLDQFIIDLNCLIAGKRIKREDTDEYVANLTDEVFSQEGKNAHILADYIKEINDIAEKIDYPATNNPGIVWHYTDVLPSDLAEKLVALSKQREISIFNLLLLAWSTFITKIFNQPYALINYPVNIRTDKSIPGCFINLVTLPLNLTAEDTYLSLIDAWHDKITFFKRVARIKLNEEINMGQTPTFADSNFSQPSELIIGKKSYIAKAYAQIAHSNLSLKYREKSGNFFFSCDMIAELFPDYFASSLLRRFFNYLNRLLINPPALLSKLDLTFNEEKKQLLYNFNNTSVTYPYDKTICQLFEEQVKITPNAVAITFENQQLTYQELNEKSNQLARYIINLKLKESDQQKIKSGTLIVVCIESSLDMIIGILGILKTGNAYIPIDPVHLNERTKFILEDANSKLILTKSYLQKRLIQIDKSTKLIALDKIFYENESNKNLPSQSKANDLAYVMYTSGTTGSPKGVMVEHRSVVSLVKNINYFCADQSDTFILLSDIAFDATIFEIWGALLNGSRLFIPNNRLELLSNSERFKNILKNKNITILWLTKTLFDQIYILNNMIFSKLKYLLIGGEALSTITIKQLCTSNYKPHNLVNGYGPTENTTFSCTYNIEKDKIKNLNTIPIGAPISNRIAHVLDYNMQLLPIGVIGELYVGGAGLARGYLNQSNLTRERFVRNPFATDITIEKGYTYLYKTGDLVRWLVDGNLEYIGRNDCQVKIRGYRIELGEIEHILSTYPGIKFSLVLQKEKKGNMYLIGYYIAESEIKQDNILDYLKQRLPDYMIPHALVSLKNLPLTKNDKLDKKALPDFEFPFVESYQAPDNNREKLICEAFARVLKLEKIGVNDNFFDRGGNSLKAITLVSNLQANFNINVADVYNFKTPQKIAKYIAFEKNNLQRHLEKIKLNYQTKNDQFAPSKMLFDKLTEYRVTIQQLPKDYQKKYLVSVLLTGATGFLGCNLLYQLLTLTDYQVFLLIRANSDEEAFARINKKFQLYFDKKLDAIYKQRLFVLASNIEQPNLGLSQTNYKVLATQIDSILHAAALTKHYGDYATFYSANVQATINLLELCKLTYLKDFHYISTFSVLEESCISYYDDYVFTEDDIFENIAKQSNIYVKTKYEGEKAVIHYRQQGINSNIYRVGNLAFIASNSCAQENIQDNGFFSRLKCLLHLGVIAREISIEQISPVDLTAQAIIKLFDKKQLSNYIHHVFNPYLCNLIENFSKNNVAVKAVGINDFIDTIIHCLDDPLHQKLIERFLLHQGWLNEWHIHTAVIHILQDRTQYILKQLNFDWLPIDSNVFNTYLKKCIQNNLDTTIRLGV